MVAQICRNRARWTWVLGPGQVGGVVSPGPTPQGAQQVNSPTPWPHFSIWGRSKFFFPKLHFIEVKSVGRPNYLDTCLGWCRVANIKQSILALSPVSRQRLSSSSNQYLLPYPLPHHVLGLASSILGEGMGRVPFSHMFPLPFPKFPFDQSLLNFQKILGDLEGGENYFCTDVCDMWVLLARCDGKCVCIHYPLKRKHAKLNTPYKYNLTKADYTGAISLCDLDTVLAVQLKMISFLSSHMTSLAHIKLRINLNS